MMRNMFGIEFSSFLQVYRESTKGAAVILARGIAPGNRKQKRFEPQRGGEIICREYGFNQSMDAFYAAALRLNIFDHGFLGRCPKLDYSAPSVRQMIF